MEITTNFLAPSLRSLLALFVCAGLQGQQLLPVKLRQDVCKAPNRGEWRAVQEIRQGHQPPGCKAGLRQCHGKLLSH